MVDPVAEQIAALSDEDWTVREEAAVRLGNLKDSRAVLPLVSILRDRDRSVRDAAIGALMSIGEPSVLELGACLGAPDLSVQEAAAAALAPIADIRVIDPLIRALRSSDWIVRLHAAMALGRIQDPRSIQPLIPLLQDQVSAVREEGAAALMSIGEAAIPVLIKALTHHDWQVRLHAVELLGKMRSQPAVEPLLSIMRNDPDSTVREDAVRALGAIGDPQAIEPLITVINEPALRTVAIEALGRIGDRRAVPVLIDVVTMLNPVKATQAIAGCRDHRDEEILTRATAVRALGAIGDESALPVLVAALESTFTRAEAAAALARFGSKVIPLLLPLLARSNDDNLRFHIKDTLAIAGWRPNRI